MLSIDEAITRERELAERNLILLDSNELVQKSYDTYLRAEYHEQLVDLLEELKAIKEMDLDIPQHFTKEQSVWIKAYCIKRNIEFYNKAIDDFIHECDKCCGFYAGNNKNLTREDMLNIAEQLKEQK